MTDPTDLIRRLKLQRLSSELDHEECGAADWQGGYDGMVELARETAAALAGLQQRLVVAERERDGEREAREKLDRAYQQKDQAMGELFRRLDRAGVDCSDLIP